MQHEPQNHARWLLAILIGLLSVSLSFAFAGHNLGVSAEAGLEFEEENDDGEDEIVETLGIRFELDGGLQVTVTPEDAGHVGDVYVPAFAEETLTKNALDDYEVHAAIRGIGVVETYPGGVIFVLEETHNQKAMTTLMEHLAAIGAQVGEVEANGRAFGFDADGVAYRAVFSPDPNGTLVYLGH
jgi:hypothetical protein